MIRGLRVVTAAAGYALLWLAFWCVGTELLADVARELAEDRSGPRLDYLPDDAQAALRAARHSGAWG